MILQDSKEGEGSKFFHLENGSLVFLFYLGID